MINAPSLANCNFLQLADDLAALIEGGVEVVHVDVMDGHYVPNLCFPVAVIRDLKQAYPRLRVDAHLMVTDPVAYLEPLASAGADLVSFPSDSTRFVRRVLGQYHAAGMRAGVAINPSQRIDVIAPYAADLDIAVLMSVEPGFAGQRFLDRSLERVAELAALREQVGGHFLIEVDGGVDPELAVACVDRGADIIITGVYAVFQQPDGIVSAVRRFDAGVRDAADPAGYQSSLDRQRALWEGAHS